MTVVIVRSKWSVGFGAFALGILALAAAGPRHPVALTISPSAHNYGSVPVAATAANPFAISLPVGAGPRDTIQFAIAGPNAGEFTVSTTPSVVSAALGTPCNTSWRRGACFYVVDFTPLSQGPKTATLVVSDSRGNRGTATLTGTGVANTLTCRPYLVSCNYVDLYSGTYSVTTVSSASAGVTSIAGRWETIVNITIVKGVASCLVTQDDWEQDGAGSTVRSRSTAKGTINGPGLFAIEFRKSTRGVLEYVLHFDCPSPTLTTHDIDYVNGTSSTGSVPSDSAEWRHASLGADPQPAAGIPMMVLQGSQKDYTNPAANNGVTVTSTMVWFLERK